MFKSKLPMTQIQVTSLDLKYCWNNYLRHTTKTVTATTMTNITATTAPTMAPVLTPPALSSEI